MALCSTSTKPITNKSSYLILLLILAISISPSAAADTCDVNTNCDFCCITKKDGSVVCEDNLIECRLKNTRDYGGVIILGTILVSWFLIVPLLVSCSQFILIGQCCFGLTFYEILENMLICCSLKKKRIDPVEKHKRTMVIDT